MVAPHTKPTLTAPRLDMTISWSSDIFKYQLAIDHLGAVACPVAKEPGLAFPLFTIKVKGAKGTLRVTRLQHLHNGDDAIKSVACQAILQRREAGENFQRSAHALSLQLTAESIQAFDWICSALATLEVRLSPSVSNASSHPI